MARRSAPEPPERRLAAVTAALRVVAGLVVLVASDRTSDPWAATVVLAAAGLQVAIDARARRVRTTIAARQAAHVGHAARVDERACLARDLHDSVTSSLTGLALQAGALRTRLAREEHPLAATAAEVHAAARRAACESRTVLTSLRRPTEPTPAAGELARVVHEAVRNAAAHAPGATVTITTGRTPDGGRRVVVQDDGPGFDPTVRPAAAEEDGHFGLVGMAEQVQRIGGSIDVVTAPGAGTRVVIRLPGATGDTQATEATEATEAPMSQALAS